MDLLQPLFRIVVFLPLCFLESLFFELRELRAVKDLLLMFGTASDRMKEVFHSGKSTVLLIKPEWVLRNM